MITEMEELRRQIARLQSELAATHRTIGELDARPVMPQWRRLLAMIGAASISVLVLVSWMAAPAGKAMGSTVTAPFEVVDDTGMPIFRVQSDPRRGFYIYNSAKVAVGLMVAYEDGAFVKVAKEVIVNKETGQRTETSASMGAMSSLLRFQVKAENKVKVIAGADGEGGNGMVQVKNAEGLPVADLSVTAANTGRVAVLGPTGKVIAYLAESKQVPGGGAVGALDPAGMPAFWSEANKIGGEACVTRMARMWCIGPSVAIK